MSLKVIRIGAIR